MTAPNFIGDVMDNIHFRDAQNQVVMVAEPLYGQGWQRVDALYRSFAGEAATLRGR